MNRALIKTVKKSSGDDNLIPLINIVFLLLIFFMVAGQFKTAQSGAVQLPSSSQSEAASVQKIKIIINQQGEMFLNQTASSASPISSQALRDYIEQLPVMPSAISLYADRELKAAQLHLALSALANYPQLSINLHTRKGAQD